MGFDEPGLSAFGLEHWQEKIDRAFAVAPDDRAALEKGGAAPDLLARIFRAVHATTPEVAARIQRKVSGKYAWEDRPRFHWPWELLRVPLTRVTLEARVATYRFWYPTYGDMYQLASALMLEPPPPNGGRLFLPRRLAGFRIDGPVRVHVVEGVREGGDIVGLTLLPGVDVAERAPGVPNPGEFIHDAEGNIIVPAADR